MKVVREMEIDAKREVGELNLRQIANYDHATCVCVLTGRGKKSTGNPTAREK